MTSDPVARSPVATEVIHLSLAGRKRFRNLWILMRGYVALAKPGIIWLLLVTTIPAMVMADGGWPGFGLVALVLLGGVLTSGGANTLNQWFDRDIDAVMHRTQGRPIPRGLILPWQALVFGLALVVAGGLQLALTVNLISAGLALAAVAFYVLVYTVWLKRLTTQNIVIGGAAGSVPPLVGWAAIQGGLDLAPVLLFLIIFLWTPPHFWALALHYKDDYARARIPMLPVVSGELATKRQIFLYAVLLVPVSALLIPFSDVGLIYLGVALALGLGFVTMSWLLWVGRVSPMKVFFTSIAYLPLLFIVAGIDAVL